MLTFNPEERWTAQQCVNHKLFDTLRVPDHKVKAKHLIDLSELDGPGMYDYENFTNNSLKVE